MANASLWLSRLLTCNLMFSDVTDFKMNSWTFSQCEFCVSVCTLSQQEMLTHLVELPRRLYSLKHAHRLIWQLITAGVINTHWLSQRPWGLCICIHFTHREAQQEGTRTIIIRWCSQVVNAHFKLIMQSWTVQLPWFRHWWVFKVILG